ncbi:MAG: hypothetical protein ABEK10_02555 [Candidatus Nanosalina sp.]
MSILGGGSGEEAENPEQEIEMKESEVIEELQDLQKNMEKMLEAESSLVKGLENGIPKERIKDRVGSIEIFLEEDIQPEEENLENKIHKLEKREARLKKQGQLREGHQKLLETIEDAISKVRGERERLRDVVNKAGKLTSNEDFSHEKVLGKLEDELQTEEREARVLEEEISEIKSEEAQIQS